MNPFDIFLPILIHPLINILLAFYHVANSLGLPGPLGWSIIFLTVIIRLAVFPLFSAQLRNQKKMAELKPRLDELKRKHGHDKKRHQEEQMKLYAKHGFNPAAGCVPTLLQTVVLFGLYYSFFPILSEAPAVALQHLNEVAYWSGLQLTSLNEQFFGLSLSTSPSKVGPELNIGGIPVAVGLIWLPILTALLQFVLSKMMQPATTPTLVKDEKKDESFQDALASSQSSFLLFLPLVIGYFAYNFQVGLSLYWNVTNIFAIIQQYLIVGTGGLGTWLPKRLTK